MDAPWTAVYDTPNKSVRQNVARRGVVLHHAALTSLDVLRSLTMGAKEVSASAICKNTLLEKMMGDGYRAWSLSDGYWDSALRSVETCNESTNGWTISDASHWKLAAAVAYWSATEGWWPHRDGAPTNWTVIGHREVYSIHGGSYATACPGGMDLNLVTSRAQALRNGAGPAGGGTTPIQNKPKENKMYLAWDTGGTGWLVTEDGWAGLPSMQVYNLFKRLIVSNQSADRPESFNRAEVDMMNNVIRGLALANNTQAAPPTVDSALIAKAVAEALKPQLGGIVVDSAAIAKAVDAALLDNFTAVPKAVVDEDRRRQS